MTMPIYPFSKVLILAGCPHATVKLYRCIHLQEQLGRLGLHAEVQDWYDEPIPSEQVDRFDLLVLQRTMISANLRRLIDAMHRQDKLVIFDTDDLVFEPAMIDWHRAVQRLSPGEQALYAEGVQRTLVALEASDAVLAASPLLVELAQRRGKPAFLHRNAVGSEMQALGDQLYHRHHPAGLPGAKTSQGGSPLTVSNGIHPPPLLEGRDRLILGYGSGTPTHDADFATVVPALMECLTRFPQVELWLMGEMETPLALDLCGPRIRRFPLTGWQSYLEQVSQLDIMLAPLEEANLFCRAKSEIKVTEAGLLGIPTVAARTDPFEGAIRPGVDGLLAGNTIEWTAALERLISQPDFRRQLGAAARQTVTQRYSLAARTVELEKMLAEVSAVTRQASKTRRPGDWETGNKRIAFEEGWAQSAEVGKSLSARQTSVPLVDSPRSTADGTEISHARRDMTYSSPLVLNWVVTEPVRGSGGHLGVLRMIRHLVEFGHECHVYVVAMEQMHHWSDEQIRTFVDGQISPTGAHFHLWTGQTGEADATIATYWSTVYDVLPLPNPGRLYYLVQDFEPAFYPIGANYLRAENTYRQGLHCITLGPWLAKLMRERYQAQADPFDFAVETDIYRPLSGYRQPHPRLAFYARPSTPRRAYELGIDALSLVKRQYPEVEIILFGANELTLPAFPATLIGLRNPHELAALYASCDAGLVLSLTNPSFVPFEMMACKCPVVDLRSERVEGLLVDRQTALLADPTPESIASALLELLWDKALNSAIGEAGYRQTRDLSWQNSARQIERVLLNYAPPPAARRLARRVQQEDARSLLWQIHQLLGQQRRPAEQTAELEAMLQRTLEEKALLAQQLRQIEITLGAAQNDKAPQRAPTPRPTPAQTLAESNRLIQRSWHLLRSEGAVSLLREARNYLRWQVNKRRQL